MPSCAKSTFYTPFLMPVNQFETTLNMFSRSAFSWVFWDSALQVSFPAKCVCIVCVYLELHSYNSSFLITKKVMWHVKKTSCYTFAYHVIVGIPTINTHCLKKRRWDGMGAGPFAYIQIFMLRVKSTICLHFWCDCFQLSLFRLLHFSWISS